jgi:CheY-like chemotaxis protein
MKVLIADDDDSTRITLKGLLRNKDCDIVEVESGDQALEVIQSSSPPDLILLDWNMPGLSGVEVVSLLRETMQADDQPYVIIISAYE